MSDTPHLALPLLAAAQAQKHVTHNEALAIVDALVHLAVKEERSNAPGTPEDGARYLVTDGATGVFATHDKSIAVYDLGAWRFLAPKAGWRAYLEADRRMLVFDGSAWRDLPMLIRTLNDLDRLGLGTSADDGNRLAAKLNGALFTALFESEGGSGDLRFVLNKENAGNIVSQLYQSRWSGRAETGLLGSDDFIIKVSGDGSTWREALKIRAETGEVAFPSGAAGLGGLRNRLLNADFSVNQRVFAGGALAAGVYGFDRWKAGPGGCTLGLSGDGTVTLSGPLVQVIERPRLADQAVTVSVEDPTAPLTVDVAGASGTIAAGPGRRFTTLVLPSGATGDVTVTFTGSGGTFARPVLVAGQAPGAFEPVPAALMLSLCQRYYEKSYDMTVAPGTATTSGGRVARPAVSQMTVETLAAPFAVRKRAIPAMTWYSTTGFSGRVRNSTNSADAVVASVSFMSETGTGAPVLAFAPTVGHLLQAHWTADAEL